jgi:DNA replication protein DnaC
MNPIHDTSARLAATFEAMMAACDRRLERWRPAVEDAPTMGPCPLCGDAEGGPLDLVESLERSVRHDAVALVYAPCDDCEAEAGTRERLARYGVPRRVRGAQFSTFVAETPAQRAGVDSVRDWVRSVRAEEGPREWALLLLGGCGTGKGHLAAAALRSLGCSAHWTTQADLIADWHGMDLSRRQDYVRRLRRYPFLVVDEIGGKDASADTAELFTKLLDARYDAEAPTVLVSNLPLRARREGALDVLTLLGGERIESRLKAGARVVFCNWGDYRGKEAGK